MATNGRNVRVWRTLCLAVTLMGGLILSGCGNGLNGNKYETAGVAAGALTISFKSSAKADVTVMGTTREVDYEKNGDKVTLKNPVPGTGSDNLVLTINKDGSLTGPEGVILQKKG